MTEKEFKEYTVPFLVQSTIDNLIVRVESEVLDHLYKELHFSGSVVKDVLNYSNGYYSDTWRLEVFTKYEEFQDKMTKAIRRVNEKKG